MVTVPANGVNVSARRYSNASAILRAAQQQQRSEDDVRNHAIACMCTIPLHFCKMVEMLNRLCFSFPRFISSRCRIYKVKLLFVLYDCLLFA